jgi:hypothetical protein
VHAAVPHCGAKWLNRFGIAPMKAARSGKFAFVHGMEWL